MIKIVQNGIDKAVFVKDDRNESWFNHKCSDENLLKILDRQNETIEKVRWEDGEHIASILNVYFKQPS